MLGKHFIFMLSCFVFFIIKKGKFIIKKTCFSFLIVNSFSCQRRLGLVGMAHLFPFLAVAKLS